MAARILCLTPPTCESTCGGNAHVVTLTQPPSASLSAAQGRREPKAAAAAPRGRAVPIHLTGPTQLGLAHGRSAGTGWAGESPCGWRHTAGSPPRAHDVGACLQPRRRQGPSHAAPHRGSPDLESADTPPPPPSVAPAAVTKGRATGRACAGGWFVMHTSLLDHFSPCSATPGPPANHPCQGQHNFDESTL